MDSAEQTIVGSTGSSGFRLEQLFGSRTRARLLGLFLENSEKAYYVRDLARRVDAQLNAVRRELKNLVDLGIVKEGEGEAVAEEGGVEGVTSKELKRYYRVDADFVLFEDLRRLMKKASVLMNRSLIEELQKAGEAKEGGWGSNERPGWGTRPLYPGLWGTKGPIPNIPKHHI